MWVAHRDPVDGTTIISERFTDAEQERFRNLLELAARSPYPGERANALAAATRLADRHGLTLEEAARGETTPSPPPPPEREAAATARAESVFARALHMMDVQLRADKARREAALQAARERGLDAEEEAARRRSQRQSRTSAKRWRRNPYVHARVLLRETALPLQDIVDITGLDIYKIVEMKLKMREEAGVAAR